MRNSTSDDILQALEEMEANFAGDASFPRAGEGKRQTTTLVELIESNYLKGTPVRDADGDPQACVVIGFSVSGRLLLAQLRKEKHDAGAKRWLVRGLIFLLGLVTAAAIDIGKDILKDRMHSGGVSVRDP